MKVIYNHPSVPKHGIKVNVSYELDYVKSLFEDYEKYFAPVDGTWKKKRKLEKIENEEC